MGIIISCHYFSPATITMQSNRNHAQPSQKVGMYSMYMQYYDYHEPVFFSNDLNF